MNLRKLTDQVTGLFSAKTDAGTASNSTLAKSNAASATDPTPATGGKSFRDYVKSTKDQSGTQRLGDIALTESYGSALAAQILATRSQDVALAQSEYDKRQIAFDRDLKQLLTDNGLDAETLPTLNVNERGRIIVSGYQQSEKLEAILNSTPGVGEALDELATAKIVLAQMQKQVAAAAQAGPGFAVSFDGARAQLAAEKKITALGETGGLSPSVAASSEKDA